MTSLSLTTEIVLIFQSTKWSRAEDRLLQAEVNMYKGNPIWKNIAEALYAKSPIARSSELCIYYR